jgi:hypothetical protein
MSTASYLEHLQATVDTLLAQDEYVPSLTVEWGHLPSPLPPCPWRQEESASCLSLKGEISSYCQSRGWDCYFVPSASDWQLRMDVASPLAVTIVVNREMVSLSP